MNDYDTRNERGTLETDFDQLPGETSTVGEVSTVVSVRLRGAELATVEQVRNPARRSHASARAEAIQIEARELIALLHGEAA